MEAIALEVSGQQATTSAHSAVASVQRQAEIARSSPPSPDAPLPDTALADTALADAPLPDAPLPDAPLAVDLPIDGQSAPRWDTRPDKFALETRLIELGATLSAAQQMFKLLERDFYLAAFGRYDE